MPQQYAAISSTGVPNIPEPRDDAQLTLPLLESPDPVEGGQ